MSLNTHEGQKSDGSYTTGNVTEYSELDFVNFRFTIKADAAATGTMSVHFTGEDSQCIDEFFTQHFYAGTKTGGPAIEIISGVAPLVVVSYPGGAPPDGVAKDGEDWRRNLQFVFSGPGEIRYNYHLQLSNTAGECSSGSPQHSQVDSFGGDFANTGEKTVPIPSNKILENPTITVFKYIDRGNGTYVLADAGEFGFKLDGAGAFVPIDAGASVKFDPSPPLTDGNHTVTESQLSFTKGTYVFDHGTGTNCTFTGSTATANIAKGQTAKNATCNFYNKPATGTLTLVKRVVNDNGGTATVTAFGVNTSAGALNFGAAVEGPTNTFTYTSQALTVNAGSYTLRENDIAGYAEGTWSCTGATANPTSISAGAVVVPNGGTVVCTITNDDQAGSLQIVKRVVNDNGGTATVTAFGVNTSAGALNFGAAVEGPTNTFTYTSQALTVNAGSYTLRENDIAGYAEGTWSCTGATANPTSISAGAVVVPNGGTVVCTITNDDQAGSLQIVKRVVNDNGGTATVTAFGVNTSAGALNFGAAVEGPTNTFTYTSQALTVNAGSYTLRENDIAGYAEGTWSCTGATANPTSISAGAVVVPNGGTVVCTITNDDQAGSLQIVKRVVNDNGGTATVTAFGVNTSAGALNFGAAVEGPTNTFTYTSQALTVNAGSYTLRENDIAGYAEGTWSCTGATANPTSISAGAVVVPNGGTVVCTITNDDQAGSLHRQEGRQRQRRHRHRDGLRGQHLRRRPELRGGRRGPHQHVQVHEPALTVNAGSYTLRENDIAGYAEGTWSCTGATANPTSITLARSSCPTAAPSSAPSPTTTRRAACRSSSGSSTTTAAPPP